MKGDKKRNEQEATTINSDLTCIIRGATVCVSCAIPDVNNGLMKSLVEAILPITMGGSVALELADVMEGGIADA